MAHLQKFHYIEHGWNIHQTVYFHICTVITSRSHSTSYIVSNTILFFGTNFYYSVSLITGRESDGKLASRTHSQPVCDTGTLCSISLFGYLSLFEERALESIWLSTMNQTQWKSKVVTLTFFPKCKQWERNGIQQKSEKNGWIKTEGFNCKQNYTLLELSKLYNSKVEMKRNWVQGERWNDKKDKKQSFVSQKVA